MVCAHFGSVTGKMLAIEVKGLVKRYRDGKEALKGIDFEVAKGKTFGLLGPNGAGKTTTLLILTTMLRKTSGIALVCGIDVDDGPGEIRKRIGVVFQASASDDQMTGRENLEYVAGLYGIPPTRAKSKIDQLLGYMNLKESADVLVKRYSGGMRRKLELAAALLNEPEIIFLDEPTIGLDPTSRAEFWDYMGELKKNSGITVFLNTHYLDEAEKLCDEVAIIDKGRIIAKGSPSDLKSKIKGDIVLIRVKNAGQLFKKKAAEIAGVKEIVGDGPNYTLKCENSNQVIPSLVTLLRDQKMELEQISVIHPSLEQVFLEITGYRYAENRNGSLMGDYA